MSFAKLREILGQTPSTQAWDSLCSVFDTWSSPEELSPAVDYVDKHIQGWPDELRHIADLSLNKRFPVYWPLVRSIRYSTSGSSLPSAFLKRDFSNITILILDNNHYLKTLDGIENLQNLRQLSLDYTKVEDFGFLDSLLKLEKLSIRHNHNFLTSYISEHTEIRELALDGCSELTNVDGLKKLAKLELVTLHSMTSLRDVDGLKDAEELRELNLEDCWDLESIQALSNKKKLSKLHLSYCYEITDFSPLGTLENLEELSLEAEELHEKAFQYLASLQHLKNLSLSYCEETTTLDFLKGLSSLESLHLEDCLQLQNIAALSSLPRLRQLSIMSCPTLQQADAIAQLQDIEVLVLHDAISLQDLNFLLPLSSLKTLHLSNIRLHEDIAEHITLDSTEEIQRFQEQLRKQYQD